MRAQIGFGKPEVSEAETMELLFTCMDIKEQIPQSIAEEFYFHVHLRPVIAEVFKRPRRGQVKIAELWKDENEILIEGASSHTLYHCDSVKNAAEALRGIARGLERG